MIRSVAIALFLIISFTSFSQSATVPVETVETNYLQKSKHQKTAAFIFLGSGACLATTAILIPPSYSYNKVGITLMAPIPNYTFKTLLFFTGLASMVASVSFFIASSKNKKKRKSLSLKNEMAPLLLEKSFVSRPILSLTLKISL